MNKPTYTVGQSLWFEDTRWKNKPEHGPATILKVGRLYVTASTPAGEIRFLTKNGMSAPDECRGEGGHGRLLPDHATWLAIGRKRRILAAIAGHARANTDRLADELDEHAIRHAATALRVPMEDE